MQYIDESAFENILISRVVWNDGRGVHPVDSGIRSVSVFSSSIWQHLQGLVSIYTIL